MYLLESGLFVTGALFGYYLRISTRHLRAGEKQVTIEVGEPKRAFSKSKTRKPKVQDDNKAFKIESEGV